MATHDATRELLADLARVYDDADALYAGWSCSSSTECCRFGITGREPYVTSIELALVERAVSARGGRRPPRADKKPDRRALKTIPDERRCPMLDDAGRCVVYSSRPLGCRTFYCDRASPAGKVKQREVNELVRRVRDIATRHEPGGDLGRPLTRALSPSRGVSP